MGRTLPIRLGLLLLPMLAAILLASACGVRQRVIVTTEPSGAAVTMNGVHLGETPLEHPFKWFWYYDFIATMEGYQTTGERVRFRAPVWLWPGFDLLSEMMPFYVPSTKRVHLVLDPVDQRPRPALAGVDEAGG